MNRPATPPPPSNPADAIVISGTALYCAAGDHATGAWSAAMLNLGVAEPDTSVIAPRGNGNGSAPALVAPIGELQAQGLSGAARLAAMLRRAAARLPLDGIDMTRVLLHLALPPQASARGDAANDAALTAACREQWPRLPAENIRLTDAGHGLAGPLLAEARRALQESRWDAAIVGAVDTLVGKESCLELSAQERLMTYGDASGIIPGEGGAFVLLEKERTARGRGAPVHAVLAAVAHLPEPHAGAADRHPATGLPAAISNALAQAGLDAADIGGMVLSAGQEAVDSLELYQTTQQIWPWKISERQRLALQLEEIEPGAAILPDDPLPTNLRTYRAFGELGAATLPLQLVLAAEWFAVDRRWSGLGLAAPRRHVLVCETGDALHRGAVILSNPVPPEQTA